MKISYTQKRSRFILAALAVLFFSCTSADFDSRDPAIPDSAESQQTPAEDQQELKETEGNDALEYAETRPQARDKTELVVAVASDRFELDPRKSYLASEAQIYTGLYEGLFSYHPFTLEPIPAMAADWELSEDETVWTFTLRKNARYWNGDAVEAEHFRSAWISLLSPELQAPYSSLFDIIQGARDYRLGLNTDKASVGIEAPDAETLIIRLNSPASFFPSMLCHHSFSPVHPKMLELQDWSETVPVSNGPFYISDRSDNRITLTRNELYWDVKQILLERIVLRSAKDEDEAAALWDSGEARWISTSVNLEKIKDRSGIVVNPMFATHYYFIRSSQAPWNDYRIRRALSISLPWAELRDGHYIPADTLIYPISGYPSPEGLIEQKLEEARELLAEAGYPKGVGLPELLILITPSQDATRISSLMAQTWKEELGINSRAEIIPYDDYFSSLKRDDYVVGSTTWIGDFADPYTFLQMWRKDSNLNDAKYIDDDYEELIELSMTQDGQERLKTLSQAEQMLLDRGLVLPISHSPALNIIDTEEIDGWYPNALDIHPFKYLFYKSFKALPGIAMGPIH